MSYKLNYWNVPGRGESIRLMLAIGGFQFENNFIPLPLPIPNPPDLSPAPFDDGTWSEMKGSTPWGVRTNSHSSRWGSPLDNSVR